MKAAQTGHMVMSTLHTNDAPTTLTRLSNMGVAAFNIAASVLLITAQRLARKLCENCKTPADYPREAMLKAGFKAGGSRRQLEAVSRGRLFDVQQRLQGPRRHLPGHAHHRRHAEDHPRFGQWRMDIAEPRHSRDGVRDLRQSGLLKVRAGVTTLEELISVTNE